MKIYIKNVVVITMQQEMIIILEQKDILNTNNPIGKEKSKKMKIKFVLLKKKKLLLKF